MSEEFFFTPENKTSVVLKTNADIIRYLCGSPIMEREDTANLIKAHSAFILEMSDKIVKAERLDFKSVK